MVACPHISFSVCNSLEHKIYDYPHKLATQEMFRIKVSHAKPKKDEVAINMVLNIETRSHIGVAQKKEPWKTKSADDWEKEQLQKTFEWVIQQMQTPESIVEPIPKS